MDWVAKILLLLDGGREPIMLFLPAYFASDGMWTMMTETSLEWKNSLRDAMTIAPYREGRASLSYPDFAIAQTMKICTCLVVHISLYICLTRHFLCLPV